MKVFISWSGPTSRRVALALKEWLPYVLNTLEPFVSSEDIDKGARWGSDIASQLEETNFGIVCLTPENLGSPWINFEAGALSKAVDIGRVSPFLHGVKKADVKPPLGLFQATDSTREDASLLIRSLNAAAGSPITDYGRLDRTVDRWWPDLEQALAAIPAEAGPAQAAQQASRRSERDMLEELLSLVRGFGRDVRDASTGFSNWSPLGSDVRLERPPPSDPGGDPRRRAQMTHHLNDSEFTSRLREALRADDVFFGTIGSDVLFTSYWVNVDRLPERLINYRRLMEEHGVQQLEFHHPGGSKRLQT